MLSLREVGEKLREASIQDRYLEPFFELRRGFSFQLPVVVILLFDIT